MKITLEKIAEIANVSRGSVDKVIHNRPGVSAETREKVKAVLEKYKYEPDKAGRLLAGHKKEFVVAVISVISKNDDYFYMVKEGIDSACGDLKQYSFYLKYEMINRNDEDIIFKTLTALSLENVNVIVLPPYNSKKIQVLLGDLIDKGIHIVTYSTDISEVKRLFYVGNDYYRSGVVAASLMAKLLNRSGKIVVFGGDKGVKCHEDRSRGFLDYMSKNYPDVTVIEHHESNESQLQVYFYMKGLLEKHSDIDGFFIVSRGVEGIVTAIKDHNREKRPKIVTFDFYADMSNYLESDDIDFIVDQNPFEQGKLIINTLFDYLILGKEIENDNIYTPLTIYIKENI